MEITGWRCTVNRCGSWWQHLLSGWKAGWQQGVPGTGPICGHLPSRAALLSPSSFPFTDNSWTMMDVGSRSTYIAVLPNTAARKEEGLHSSTDRAAKSSKTHKGAMKGKAAVTQHVAPHPWEQPLLGWPAPSCNNLASPKAFPSAGNPPAHPLHQKHNQLSHGTGEKCRQFFQIAKIKGEMSLVFRGIKQMKNEPEHI